MSLFTIEGFFWWTSLVLLCIFAAVIVTDEMLRVSKNFKVRRMYRRIEKLFANRPLRY